MAHAESELMGLLTPGHSGADRWRAHRLRVGGPDGPTAYADVALDRLVGAVGLALFVLVAGAALPPQVLLAAVGLSLAVLPGAVLLRRHRPHLVPVRPPVPVRRLVHGRVLSLACQLTVLCMLLGGLAATGHTVPALALMGVFGASQVAGVLPGVRGAGPEEGALVAGIVALGVPSGSALGAVSVVGRRRQCLGTGAAAGGRLPARAAPPGPAAACPHAA